MKIELMYLVWVSVLTALIWVPYILDRVMVWGLLDAVGYSAHPKAQSPWTQRMMKATTTRSKISLFCRPGAGGAGSGHQQ
jgi:hypothetical protein